MYGGPNEPNVSSGRPSSSKVNTRRRTAMYQWRCDPITSSVDSSHSHETGDLDVLLRGAQGLKDSAVDDSQCPVVALNRG